MTSSKQSAIGVSVELEPDVYEYLKQRSTFEDTVNTVLRRELNLRAPSSELGPATPADPDLDGAPSRDVPESRVVTTDRPAATPPPAASREQRTPAATTKRSRAAAGTLLPESEYFRPILEFLVDSGGSAPKQQVIEEIGRKLADRLTEADRSALQSGGIRWQSRVQFARLRLVDQGLMDKNTQRGIWAVTPDGMKALEEEAV